MNALDRLLMILGEVDSIKIYQDTRFDYHAEVHHDGFRHHMNPSLNMLIADLYEVYYEKPNTF